VPGLLPAMIGLIQATEVAKRVLGITTTQPGRFLMYDALGMTLRTLSSTKDPERLRRWPGSPGIGTVRYTDISRGIPAAMH